MVIFAWSFAALYFLAILTATGDLGLSLGASVLFVLFALKVTFKAWNTGRSEIESPDHPVDQSVANLNHRPRRP